MPAARDDVEVRPSTIEGLGVFATRPFRAGERIRRVNVVREITPEAPIREDLGERTDHCNYPDGRVVLYGPPDRHLNHSCDPNAREAFEDGVTWLLARRGIAAGDEITCDYNINIADGSAWPCRCGARRCRGEVVGDFFRLPVERQREYRPLLAAWFVRRHRERIAALDREPFMRTSERVYLILSGSIFFLVALLHLTRLVFHWPLVLGPWVAPYWASGVGFPVASAYCAWAFWLCRK